MARPATEGAIPAPPWAEDARPWVWGPEFRDSEGWADDGSDDGLMALHHLVTCREVGFCPVCCLV